MLDAPPRPDLQVAVDRIVGALPDAQAVYVFGSVSRAAARRESDVDLAVLSPQRLDPVARWKLAEPLAAAVGRDVDLIDLRAASAVLRVQVIGGGRLLSEPDPGARAVFEMYARSDYARLNEERRGILDAVRGRGSVRG
jgi:predicted nucleotidyltransferase